MERLVAMSDSHGRTGNLRVAIELALGRGKIHTFVFLGDGLRDLDEVRPLLTEANPAMRLVAVRGNNDVGSFLPDTEEFFFGAHRVMACHGHAYNVKFGQERICYAASARDASILLYGHTHRSQLTEACGVTMVNPGAVCDNDAGKAAFAEMVLGEDGRLRAELVGWDGEAL